MKYLFRVLFILALFCGVASHARAQGWHAGVVDPLGNFCAADPNGFACSVTDPTMPITGAEFNPSGCSVPTIPALPTPPMGETLNCIDLFNQTGLDLASVTLTGLPADGTCDSNSAFTCTVTGDGDVFSFAGLLHPGHTFVIYEYGLPPTDFNGLILSVTATPEPDSLLLLSTGAMMIGLYMAKRRNLFAFGKK